LSKLKESPKPGQVFLLHGNAGYLIDFLWKPFQFGVWVALILYMLIWASFSITRTHGNVANTSRVLFQFPSVSSNRYP